jgi:hypothetical protein
MVIFSDVIKFFNIILCMQNGYGIYSITIDVKSALTLSTGLSIFYKSDLIHCIVFLSKNATSAVLSVPYTIIPLL